jgi:hypothetical protein
MERSRINTRWRIMPRWRGVSSLRSLWSLVSYKLSQGGGREFVEVIEILR